MQMIIQKINALSLSLRLHSKGWDPELITGQQFVPPPLMCMLTGGLHGDVMCMRVCSQSCVLHGDVMCVLISYATTVSVLHPCFAKKDVMESSTHNI